MSAPPLGFPHVVNSRQLVDVLNRIDPLDPYDEEACEWWVSPSTTWRLVELPVATVVARLNFDANMVQHPEVAQSYAERLTAPPPIVVSYDLGAGWFLTDGHHRLYAAMLRGDHTIWLYLPVP